MTDGLYEAYESWTHRPAMVNEDLAHLVAKEIRASTEFHLVAQNVVENVKTKFQQSCKKGKQAGRLDDITLIVRNFGYPNLSHPSVPSTAPVVSSQESVFFPPERQIPYYPSQSVSTQQRYDDYTTSLQPYGLNSVPQGQDSWQQQPHRHGTNTQQYTGNNVGMSSVGEGAFVPEPESSPEYPTQQTNAQSGYGHRAKYGSGYYAQGPLSNSQPPPPQPPYTNDQPHHPHATLTGVSSYPDITHPPPRGRQVSVPSIYTQRPTGQTNPEYQRKRDYEYTNPLGTEQTQSELSTSRSSLYENVTLRTQDLSSTDLKRHSDSSLEQQTQAMSLQDPLPPKRTLPIESTPKKLSPVAETKTPISETPTALVASLATTPQSSLATTPSSTETTPNLKRHDSDFDMYGWRMESPPVSLNETPRTLTEDTKQEFDTLQEKVVTEATVSPKITSTLESMPVTSTPIRSESCSKQVFHVFYN